jgi:hypothetical protein
MSNSTIPMLKKPKIRQYEEKCLNVPNLDSQIFYKSHA